MVVGWRFIIPAITAGAILLFLTYLKWIDGSVNRVVDGMLQLQDGMAALERVDDMLAQRADPAPPNHGRKPRLRGKINFNQVDFSYQPEQPFCKGSTCSWTQVKHMP